MYKCRFVTQMTLHNSHQIIDVTKLPTEKGFFPFSRSFTLSPFFSYLIRLLPHQSPLQTETAHVPYPRFITRLFTKKYKSLTRNCLKKKSNFRDLFEIDTPESFQTRIFIRKYQMKALEMFTWALVETGLKQNRMSKNVCILNENCKQKSFNTVTNVMIKTSSHLNFFYLFFSFFLYHSTFQR